MLIIWGLRVFFRTIGEGTFHCPRCGGDRRYRLRAGRRFVTLFFIPVIPLNKVGQHVRCATCGARYHQGVLTLPTAAQMQAALPAGMRAGAATMLRAGGAASGAARQRAIEAVVAAGGQDYDGGVLDADLAGTLRTADDLARVGAQLAVEAREWFLAEMVRIAMADGPLTGAERDAAHTVGTALGMTRAQILGVIALAEQEATSE